MDVPWNNTSNITGDVCEIISQSVMERTLFPVYYIFLLISGSCGNILAIHLILKRTKKANSSDIYIINLAVSDALFTLSLPARIAYYILGYNWYLGEWMCRLTGFILYTNIYVGIYFMTCVSVDRYIAVVHAMRYRRFRKARNAKCISLVLWCLVFMQTVPLLTKSMTQVVGTSVTCMEFFGLETIPNLPLLLLVACILFYIIPAGIILLCYLQIKWKLCKLLKTATVDRKQRFNKVFSAILAVLVAVILCFSPYHINIMQFMIRKLLYKPSCREYMVFKRTLQITMALMNINCSIDPIIYFFVLKGYKRKIVSIFIRNASISTLAPERESQGGTFDGL